MKIKRNIRNLLIAGLLIGCGSVYADDDLDVTMRMVPPGLDLPNAVTKVIALPVQTPDGAKGSAQKGLDKANESRMNVEIPQVEVPKVEVPKVEVPRIELPEQSRGRGRP